jgi:Ni/Co efflux regulator RcnB
MNGPQDIGNDPELKQHRDEMEKLMADGGPFGENATQEKQDRFLELQSQMQEKMMGKMQETMQNAIKENLTPEQMKKIKEAQISMMSTIPIVSPSMFEALDLSDAQKKQLDGIKKEMEPEFEKHVDKLVDLQMKMMEKMQDALADLDGKMGNMTPEERREYMQNIQENIRKSNPDLQRAMDEMMKSGQAFSDKLKFKMFDVLTDAQWKRMTDLIDNPPEYMKKVMAEMRKQMGTDDSRTNRSPSTWAPGPNSWKPGDAIPEQYRQQRIERGRFPRGETTSEQSP